MKAKELLQKLFVAVPVMMLAGLAVVGTSFDQVTPFVETVVADEYGSDDEKDEDEVVITEEQRKDIEYRASTAGQVANNKTVSSVSIGNNIHHGGTRVGGGVTDAYNVTPLVQQVQATGANLDAGEIPYSKINEAGPVAKAVLTNSAISQGFLPGGAMNIEVGNFTTYGGYKACDKLNAASNFDVYIKPLPGYTPGVLMLQPDGSTKLLNANEFDTTRSDHAFGNGTRLYTIRTTDPKATYMTVYIPVAQ